MSLFFSPKHISTYKGLMSIPLWPKELMRIRITGQLEKQWRTLLALSGACVSARIVPFLKRKKFFHILNTTFFGCVAKEHWRNWKPWPWDRGTIFRVMPWKARAPEKCRGELRLRTYTLKGILSNMSISVKLGACTLFMEIRNYSSNFKTSPVIYFRAIFIT